MRSSTAGPMLEPKRSNRGSSTRSAAFAIGVAFVQRFHLGGLNMTPEVIKLIRFHISWLRGRLTNEAHSHLEIDEKMSG